MIIQIAQRFFQNQATRVIHGTLIRPDFSFSAEKSLCILYNQKRAYLISLFWTNEVESLSKQSLRSPHRSAKGGGAVGCLLDKVVSLSK